MSHRIPNPHESVSLMLGRTANPRPSEPNLLGHGIKPSSAFPVRRGVRTSEDWIAIRKGTFDAGMRLTPQLHARLIRALELEEEAIKAQNKAFDRTASRERYVKSADYFTDAVRPTGIYTQATRFGQFSRQISGYEVRKEEESVLRGIQRDAKTAREAAEVAAIRFFALFAATAAPDALDNLSPEVAGLVLDAARSAMPPLPEDERTRKRELERRGAICTAAIDALLLAGDRSQR